MTGGSPTRIERRRMVVLTRRLVGRGVRLVLRTLPFEVFRRVPNHHYVPDYYGRSAIKAIDIRGLPVFGELAREAVAQGRTFLYYDKLYTVFQTIQSLAHTRSATNGRSIIRIADIGAFRGGGGYFMAACAEALGFERVELHCFDTFAGHQKEDVRPELEPTQEAGRQVGRYTDVSPGDVRQHLAKFPAAVVHVGRIQDTAAEVESMKFDFAHIDVNLYEPTSFALSFLHDRLVDDGIVVVDDYGNVTNQGVQQAVDEFVDKQYEYVRFHLLTDECLLIKRSSASGP